MNMYLEAEKHLAELLGWTDIVESDVVPNVLRGTPSAKDSFTGIAEGTMKVPRYTRSNDEIIELLCNQELDIEMNTLTVRVAYWTDSANNDYAIYKEDYKDHVDKATAVRYAIVMATIRKLEAMK